MIMHRGRHRAARPFGYRGRRRMTRPGLFTLARQFGDDLSAGWRNALAEMSW